ncbi:LarC family nickel insertion protein (plasmid) [Microvirga sp. RSM25]|uniref:LarC family nickel insertion protein n=1 Tax=Microvirga sp. RSM25 TaxID=3273802 RepID=UPI00384E85CC
MNIIHLDAVGGIAGDMFVGALLDAFPDLRPRVMADAASVLPPQAGVAELAERQSGAVRALSFGLSGGGHAHPSHHDNSDAPAGAHRHGSHAHNGPEVVATHRHEHSEHTHHTSNDGTFRNIVARIRAAHLAPGTADHAISILTILAEAEAFIHCVPIEQVHFHEIADWDSLLDVVAAGSLAAALEEFTWSVSALPRGGGLVRTQHGLLPVPAPATARILEGFEWRDDGIAGERVTPTGAAILKHLVRPPAIKVEGRSITSGTGAGTRVLPGIPNILRALVFEEAPDLVQDQVTVLKFEIDDMTGEEIGTAADRLRALEGVLDLSIGQRWGKKNRPMQSFSLLVRPDRAEGVIACCFTETSTIGLRSRMESRRVLQRKLSSFDSIGVKTVRRPAGESRKAENDHLTGDSLEERRQAKRYAERGGRD